MLRRGAVISAVSLGFVQVVTFVQTLALARILTPAEVGVYYSGTVLTTLVLTVSEGGLRNALVQRQRDVEVAANTVFWAGLGAGFVWALLALAAAPLISLVFDSPTAGLVGAVSAGSLVLYALTYVPDSLLQRRFDFRQRMLVQPSVTVTFAAGSVVLCSLGMGVWGLVVASYASLLVWIAISWALARWRPRRGQASVAVWREMTRFGLPLVLGALLDRAKETIDTIVVGRAFDSATVGNYRYGRRLGMLPGTVIIEIGSYVLFPAFARAAADPPRFRAAFLRAIRALWFASMPVAGMLIVLGPAVTVILLGPRWQGAGVLFAALAGSGPGVAMASVGFETIKGHGRTSLLNRVNAAALVIGLGTLFAGLPLGLVGVGLSLSAASLSAGALALWLARGVVEVPGRALTRILLPPLIAAAVSTSLWWAVEHLLGRSEHRGTALGLGVLALEGLGLLATYLLVLRAVAPSWLRELRQAVFPRTAAGPERGGD
ncbi:oligosaccharide flippase family protein [Geodermatophilus sp. SYSU D00867]